MTAATGSSVRPRRARAGVRVALLTVGTAVVTLAVQLILPDRGRWSFTHNVIAMSVITLMSVATEGFTINLRVRRGSHALGLGEVPLVLGLFTVGPAGLLFARVLGGAVGTALFRRQRGLKLAFNVALYGAQATLAAAVFGLLAGPPPALGPREWAAAYAAMIAADALAAVLVTVVISLHDDPGEWRRLPAAVVRGVPVVFVSTSIALLGGLVVGRDFRAIGLLAVFSVVVFLALRGYERQGQGHAQVEGLYAFTRALDGSLDSAEVTWTVLGEVRDQLRAEVAELLMPGPGGGQWTRTRMSGTGRLDSTMVTTGAESAWWYPAAQGRPVLWAAGRDTSRGEGPAGDAPVDGIAVPLSLGDSGRAVLLVANSLADTPTFGAQQVRLFEALANHAGLSLAKTVLVDRLRIEVSEKERLARYDLLTGLPNRQQFQELLGASLRDPGTGVTAVMVLDLDRFKEVNDALGHDTGDALLLEVADRLRQQLAGQGLVARLGGDEFAVMLSDLTCPAEALAVGHDLADAMDQPVVIDHLSLTPRVSIGIACGPEHGDAAQLLMQHADVAMYAAKRTRSGARLYEPRDDKSSAHHLSLTADLARAIRLDELTVQFQPKLDPTTGLVTGAEALARWRHPREGFISPDVFIPLAERSGLIRPLTLHVLKVALRQCAAWRRAGHDLHIAVNLSPNALHDSTLPDVVTRLLEQTGVPPASLTLEITESTLMADPTGGRKTLDRLRAIGVRLSIDDFGTGYSSLGRLRNLPINEVKIDKSFVQRLAEDHRDRAVVRSAIQLGHALDLDVVAEGVEDAATLEHLRREGCDLLQGYFISKPLAAADFAAWLVGRTSRERDTALPRAGA
ncbi:bifunctional diguanylate cyclase/phosphodiesterase [Planosporangium flavigriseum]|uniref:putative bifunctional diguanylate cyclase/phosphodiesterase n=1 Tax=Planosporangium flavigriseum TaxID=373681 RepID=UPI00143C015A|nr:GGDEF domain-containing protein [Planosporangium flavigriseum]NJC67243.1 bifunctional diguanylate cyclase/phosphodiesterase [Planosporangium flavigriseum]